MKPSLSVNDGTKVGGRCPAVRRLAAGFLMILGAQACAPSKTPNVLLVTLDTTRADHLSCYGYEKKTSPVLDKLAEQGVLFEKAMAQAAVTPVSHASILTGLYPFHHGLRILHGTNYQSKLTSDQVTLAEMLTEHGYATGAFVSAFPVTKYFGLDQGFQVFDAEFGEQRQAAVNQVGMVNTGRHQRGAAETTDLALEWLRSVEGPFFAWVHYFDPHDPEVQPPPEYMRRFPAPKSQKPWDVWRYKYDIEIEYMDEHMGRLFDFFRERGEWEDLVVVVVSDHGEGLGDHNWWSHGVLYQEQIRVPLVMKGPGSPADTRIPYQVRTIDIVPTVADYVGLDLPELMDGQSLLPLFEPGAADPKLVAYADSVNMLTYKIPSAPTADRKDDMYFCVSEEPWKYIRHALKPQDSKLYNLVEDPSEQRNLLTERREISQKMEDLLQSFDFRPRPAAETPQETTQESEEALERLRELGYIDDGSDASPQEPKKDGP